MYGLPAWGFIGLLVFYDYGEVSLVMMNKIAGLLALILIGCSFIIGPLSSLVTFFDHLKTYRKYLGIAGVLVALIHIILSFVVRFHSDLAFMLLGPNNAYLLGVYAGLIGIGIFVIMTLTSTKRIMTQLGFHVWKMIQTAGYVGLLAVMLHFILMETSKGIFIIRRPLGRFIFVFGFFVIFLRLVVFLRGNAAKKGSHIQHKGYKKRRQR